MLGLGLGVNRPVKGFGRFEYLSELPSFVPSEYSLAFDASGAETLADYEAGTLYFRDSNFDRVGATFSRTTTATRVNKQGLIESVAANVPRIDYTDGSAKLLMEPSRTNLLTYSLDYSTWGGGNRTITSDYGVSPEGVSNSQLIEADGSGTFPRIQQNMTLTATTYTYSAFLKAGTNNFALISFANFAGQSGGATYIDLTTGVVSSSDAESIYYGNGWWKVSVKGTIDSGDLSGAVYVAISYSFSQVTFPTAAESNGKSIEVYGAQVEQGNYPTSYIPTAGSAVTRNADALSSISMSGYVGSNVATLFIDSPSNPYTTTDTSDSRVTFGSQVDSRNGQGVRVRWTGIGGAADYIDAANGWMNNKMALKLDDTTGKYFTDGVLRDTETITPTTPTDFSLSVDTIRLLHSKILIFPTALTDSECEQLTS